GQATLTITAAGDTSAGAANRTATLRVDVRARANVTGVKGRFVDGKGVGVGGVLVRHESTQVQSDSAGNFLLTGLPASTPSTLRFDATPALPLYPIWPYTTMPARAQPATIPDWTIPAPPADDKFKPITESPQVQEIVDERFPGLKISIPANASIVG